VTCVVYLDDILVFSKDPTKHLKVVWQVLEQLRTHWLYINLKKCSFSANEVKFLSFIIGLKGVTMDLEQVATILKWLTLTLVKEI
jgi:hypothetical protein